MLPGDAGGGGGGGRVRATRGGGGKRASAAAMLLDRRGVVSIVALVLIALLMWARLHLLDGSSSNAPAAATLSSAAYPPPTAAAEASTQPLPASAVAAVFGAADPQSMTRLEPRTFRWVSNSGPVDPLAWHRNYSTQREDGLQVWSLLHRAPGLLLSGGGGDGAPPALPRAPGERYACANAAHPKVGTRPCAVFINHLYKIIYVRLPKAASSSVLARLGDCRDANTAPANDAPYCLRLGAYSNDLDLAALRALWSGYFAFTFVRNPWARAYSLAKYMHSVDIVKGANRARPECGLDWRRFCANPYASIANLTAQHCTFRSFRSNMWHAFDQTHCLVTPDGAGWGVDFIGRVEHLEEDWAEVVKHINARRPVGAPPVPDGPLDAVNVKPGNISRPYDDGDNGSSPYGHCLDAVTRWYACDVERLGYLPARAGTAAFGGGRIDAPALGHLKAGGGGSGGGDADGG